MATNSVTYLTKLHGLLDHYFNLAEIKNLCFNLNVDYESVPGAEKPSMIRELLLALGRNGRLLELVSIAKQERPHVAWPPVPDDFQLPASLTFSSSPVPPSQIHVYGDVVQGDKVAGHKIQIQTYIEKQVIVEGIEITDIDQLPPKDGESPYKGLTYFTEKDADWFFGRESATSVLISRLHDLNFMAVVGASGSGKSSLVRAGVIPVMRRQKTLDDGTVPPLGEWQVQILTPTAKPLTKLADTLFPQDYVQQAELRAQALEMPNTLRSALASQSQPASYKLLLIVDQFEELFTQCKDENEQEAFITNLLAAASESCKVLITLRADFYAQCLRYEGLRQILKTTQEPIGAMTSQELTAAILEPAAKGNWQFQAGLVEEMLDDVGQEPGALPLLSHTLLETWQRRRNQVLTLSGYRESGKVQGAIAQTAEVTYTALTAPEQAIARRIFLRLTESGEGTQDSCRRVSQTELGNDAAVQTVTQRLADARLIITNRDDLGVAHEALIREWPRLRGWLDADREGLIIHRRLTNAEQTWRKKEKDPSYLFTGLRLTEAEQWSETNGGDLNDLERTFLDASLASEKRQQRIRRFVQVGVVVVLATLIVLGIGTTLINTERNNAITARETAVAAQATSDVNAVGANFQAMEADMARGTAEAAATTASQARSTAVVAQSTAHADANRANIAEATAIANRSEAELQSQIALVNSLAAQAPQLLDLPGASLELSALLAVEASNINREIDHDAHALIDSSLRSILSQPYFNVTLSGHTDGVQAVAFSPDGQIVASTSKDESIRLWNTLDLGAPPTVLTGQVGWIKSVAFSHDGRLLATVGEDVRLWDLSTPNTEPIILEEEGITDVAFSPNGQVLATSGVDHTIQLWDLKNLDSPPLILTFDEFVVSIAFSPDGNTLISSSLDTVQVWDLTIQEPEPIILVSHDGINRSVAYSPDGYTFASVGGRDRKIHIWDTMNLSLDPIVLEGHKNWVLALDYSPSGEILASADLDGNIYLWDMTNLEKDPQVLKGHTNFVFNLDFSPDGETLVSGSEDKTVRLWKLGTPSALPLKLEGHTAEVISVAYSPDGGVIASAGEDKTIRFWDADNTGAPLNILSGEAPVESVAFSPDGKLLASAGQDLAVHLWNLEDLNKDPIILTGHRNTIYRAAFSPDGHHLATASHDRTVRLWDIDDLEAEPIILIDHGNVVVFIAFSPDGQTLASGSWDYTIRLWDVSNLETPPIVLRRPDQDLNFLTFSSDGGTLAVSYDDGMIELWDTSNLDSEPKELNGQLVARGLAFSPDGKYLAAGGMNSLIQLWNLAKLGSETITFLGHEGPVTNLAFSPDGTSLASASFDQTVRVWQSPEALIDLACQEVQRNLAWEEWQRYIGEEPYRLTCPNLPVHPSVIVAGREYAFGGDKELAVAVLEKVVELDPSLELNPEKEATEYYVQGLIARGRLLAEDGDAEGAILKFEEVLEIVPDLDLDPEKEAQQYLVVGLIEQGEELARQGEVTSALALLEEALMFDPSLNIDPEDRVGQLAIPALIIRGEALAEQGRIEEALLLYEKAEAINSSRVIEAKEWHYLCWYGSLWGYVEEVYHMCDIAIEMEPENRRRYNGRALTRALRGDFQGAVDDAKLYLEWLKEFEGYEDFVAKWELLISELEMSRNPFDEATLEEFRNE